MLGLAAVNGVSVVLLGTLCLLHLTDRLGLGAFLGALAVLLVLATGLWLSTEGRHRSLPPLRRAGRVLAGMVLVMVAAPMAVLTPLFWLGAQLPAEAQFDRVIGPVMAAVLMALALAVIVNAAGVAVILVRALLGPRGWSAPRRSR